jgi:hypothetical protein
MIAASAALGALLGCQQQEKSAPPAPAAKADALDACRRYFGLVLPVGRAADRTLG